MKAAHVSEAAAGQSTRTRRKQRHPRKPISCGPCRRSKLRCDRQLPCAACKRKGEVQRCSYHDHRAQSPSPSRQLTPTTTPIHPLSNNSQGQGDPRHGQDDRESQDFTHNSWNALWQRQVQQQQGDLPSSSYATSPLSITSNPSAESVLALLPPTECCDYLIIEYFTWVAPIFHVLHEGAFQKRYDAFTKGSKTDDLSWLALLFSLFSISVQTMEPTDPILATIRERIPCASQDTGILAAELRKVAMTCLTRDNFMFHYHLVTLESLLLVTYGLSHDSGVDTAWTLLGLTLNMGIALNCNTSAVQQSRTPRDACAIDMERRQNCWRGILSLHTYQAILFRDIDITYLLGGASTPAIDTTATSTLVMDLKIRLFRLSGRICRQSSLGSWSSSAAGALDGGLLDEQTLAALDAEVAREQDLWASIFMSQGDQERDDSRAAGPRITDTTSYAHWCALQAYAHQLYLLLHRPYCRRGAKHASAAGAGHTGGTSYRLTSRRKCITSGAALLRLHRDYVHLPRLRHYRWLVNGMVGSCAVHGAMALASCLLDDDDQALGVNGDDRAGRRRGEQEVVENVEAGEEVEETIRLAPYRKIFDEAVDRIGQLMRSRGSQNSTIYVKAYPILRHLQTMLNTQQQQAPSRRDGDSDNALANPSTGAGIVLPTAADHGSSSEYATVENHLADFGESFDNWMNTIQWFDPQSINWDFGDGVMDTDAVQGQSGSG